MEQGLTSKQQENTIYKHTMRPNWGLAVIAYEDDDKRAYQFEDGKLRIFKEGYFQYLQPVDTPIDRSARTLARLGVRRAEATGKSVKKTDALPMDAQLMFFGEKYPDGFAGTKWTKTMRGSDAKRRLKRHRDAAICEAQSFLARDEMTRLMEASRHGEIVTQLVALLEKTNLVGKKKVESIAVVFEERAIPLVQALHALLHGTEGSMAVRFERWYTELGRACSSPPNWSLATAALALAQPNRHICVRPATFSRQAAWMAPRLANERAVSGLLYERWVSMAERMTEILKEGDLEARDNLDVYDFMVETLTPKHMDRGRALYQERQ